jgi:tetratricopeptide (TPR) repeat protein/predicted aspartyl protease
MSLIRSVLTVAFNKECCKSLRETLCAALAAVMLLTATAPCRAACQLGQLAQLNTTIEGDRALVPVQFNGEDSTMMVDSGAFYNLISLATATHARLRLEQPPYGFMLSGMNGDTPVSFATVKEFKIANQIVPKVLFIVGGTDFGAGASGLIGQNLLGMKDAEYDLAKGIIRLMQPKGCGKQSLAYWAQTETRSVIDIEPLTEASYHTIGYAYLNGSKIRVMFDTGVPASMLVRRAAERAGFDVNGPDVQPLGPSTGLGHGWFPTWSARFDSLKIGGEEIRNARLRVGDTSSTDVDMFLGLDFFLSHHIYVSNDQRRMYFTYNGGPVFNLSAVKSQPPPETGPPESPAPAAAGQGETADAAELSRRGMALAARHDYEHALENLKRACELAPQESTYFAQRGQVEWQSGHADLAIKDFDQALLLKTDNLEALIARSQFRQRSGDIPGAASDLDAAANAATKEAAIRLDFGQAYQQMDLNRQAIVQFDLWIAVHPEDARLVVALNDRCWARALLGDQLDLALADCNKALSMNSKFAAALDGRGLVRLRRGEYQKALSDYNDSVALQPKNAWALYGRGLTKLHLGMNAQGQADIEAAQAANPNIGELAQKYGIAP